MVSLTSFVVGGRELPPLQPLVHQFLCQWIRLSVALQRWLSLWSRPHVWAWRFPHKSPTIWIVSMWLVIDGCYNYLIGSQICKGAVLSSIYHLNCQCSFWRKKRRARGRYIQHRESPSQPVFEIAGTTEGWSRSYFSKRSSNKCQFLNLIQTVACVFGE